MTDNPKGAEKAGPSDARHALEAFKKFCAAEGLIPNQWRRDFFIAGHISGRASRDGLRERLMEIMLAFMTCRFDYEFKDMMIDGLWDKIKESLAQDDAATKASGGGR